MQFCTGRSADQRDTAESDGKFLFTCDDWKKRHQGISEGRRVYTKAEAEAKAQEELSLFFEKLRIKGLQIIENHVMIEINGKNCTASGTYVTEEESVREEIPEIVLQKQNDQEEEGNRV